MKVDPQFEIMKQVQLPDYADVSAVRRWLDVMMDSPMMQAAPCDDVTSENMVLPRPEGLPDVNIRVYRPPGAAPVGTMIYVHSGSMVMGHLDLEDASCRRYCREAGCAVVSVDYSLSPEHRFPVAVEEVYAALEWSFAHAAILGGERIAITGHSSGGLLSAAVAIMARDRNGPRLALQMLIYPALDDRMTSPSLHLHFEHDTPSRAVIGHMWRYYLGASGIAGSPYAAPARVTDMSRLAPAYLEVGAIDRCRDETIDYACRLLQSGIETELRVLPGTVHGFDMIADAPFTIQAYAARARALKRVFAQ